MRRRTGTTLAGVLGALLLATTACSGGDDETTADSNRDPETTTTTASTTTTVAAIGPPEWVEIVNDVVQRINAVESNPDAEQVPNVWADDGPNYQSVLDDVRNLQESGQHYVGDPPQVLFVKIETPDNTDVPRLTVRYTDPPWQLVDEAGAVVENHEGGEPGNCVTTVLTRDGPNGTYRLWSSSLLEGCPEEAL